MKKLFILFLLLFLVLGTAEARKIQPYDGNGRSYTSIDFYGVDWKVVTDTTTWTQIRAGQGIIYGIYCIASATSTTNTNYFRASTDTNTVVVPDIYVVADSSRTAGITEAIEFIPAKPIYFRDGLKIKPGDVSGAAETTIYILYR